MNASDQKQSLNWSELGFQYKKTDSRFRAVWRDGAWGEGEMISDEFIAIHEGAPSIHYAQQCFEGMKAQTAPDGRILLFRPDLNAQRMGRTAERLLMPHVSEEMFVRAVRDTVRANASWVPPYGSGASLYIRPMLIGVGENLGLKPAQSYEFRVFVSPVGPYYKTAGLGTIKLAVSEMDRAAPSGTGSFKAGANYAGGLLATKRAQELGANEALYLDSRERRFIDEAGSANIVVVMRDGTVVTPKSDAILPSITRRSIMTLAEKKLGLVTHERPIELRKEIVNFSEAAACGTAAVLSPVGSIWFDGEWHNVGNPEHVGPVMQQLYDLLVGIQKGETNDEFGWTVDVA